jgi:hypothetical protein
VIGVGRAGEADPLLRRAGLMDADPLGEDRCGEPGGERKQGRVPPLDALPEPEAFQPLAQRVGGDVRRGDFLRIGTAISPREIHPSPAQPITTEQAATVHAD